MSDRADEHAAEVLGFAYDALRVQSSGGDLPWDDWWTALAEWFWATREGIQSAVYGRELTDSERWALEAARALARNGV